MSEALRPGERVRAWIPLSLVAWCRTKGRRHSRWPPSSRIPARWPLRPPFARSSIPSLRPRLSARSRSAAGRPPSSARPRRGCSSLPTDWSRRPARTSLAGGRHGWQRPACAESSTSAVGSGPMPERWWQPVLMFSPSNVTRRPPFWPRPIWPVRGCFARTPRRSTSTAVRCSVIRPGVPAPAAPGRWPTSARRGSS